MATNDDEEEQLRSVALQNAQSILLARRRAEEALRKHSEWLRVTLSSIGDAVISTDTEGRVTFMNSVAETLTGWSQAEALGHLLRDVFQIVSEYNREPVENPALRALREGAIVGLANHTLLIARDGTEWPIDDSAAPIRNEQGAVAGVVLVFRDITERKRAEGVRQKLEYIFNHAGWAVAVANPVDSRLEMVNPAFAALHGYTVEELRGRSLVELLAPEAREELPRHIAAVNELGDYVYESVHLHKDGTRLPLLTHVSSFRDQSGQILYRAATFLDITERKRAEEALRDTQARLEATLSASEVATWTWDIQHDCIVADRNMARLFSVTAQDAAGGQLENYLQVLHPDDRARVQATLAEALENPDAQYEADYRLMQADGSIRWVTARGKVERDATGQPVRFPGVVIDITERKALERQLAGQQEVLEAVALGQPLPEILRLMTQVIERQLPGARASVLLANDAETHLFNGAAASLPTAYNAAIEGLAIGEQAGSCGTAAFRRERVVVSDTLADPLWANYRELARVHNLRACWSQPITSPAGKLLGTFATYFHTPREARAEELALLASSARIAGIAIERVRAQESVRERNRQLDLLTRTSHELIFGSKPAPALLQTVFDAVREQIGMEFFFNFLVGDKPRTLNLVSSAGLTPEQQACFATLRFGEYLCGLVAERRERLIVENLQASVQAEAAGLQALGVRCYGGFPLMAHDRLVGTVAFATQRRDHFREGELQLIQSICDQVAATLDRVRLFKDLHESEARFAKAFNASPLVLTISSLSTGELIEVNDTFVQTTGFSRAEALGRTTLDLGLWKKPQERAAELETVRQFGQVRDAEYQFCTRHGREITGLLSAEYIEIGGESFALTVIRDITEEKRLFEAERKAREQAEAANRLKDEFLATVSHELRTPLNHMLGWVVMLRGGKLAPEKAAEALVTIERNVRAQNRLVEDLLDVSRIVTGKMQLQIQSVVPAQVIEAVVTAARPAAEAKNVQLQVLLEARTIPIAGDPDRLQQVVWNLVSNAIKFTPNGGQVQVRLTYHNTHFEIAVSDTGEGLAPDFLPHVFDRFSQADGSLKRKHGGLGLGLAIVRHLVELHGGEVSVQSAGLGQGTTFTVKLPLTSLAEPAVQPLVQLEPAAEAKYQTEGVPSLQGVRVLVVDDEADSQLLLSTVLLEHKAEVRTAGSVVEALNTLDHWRPDVLISDIGMPNGNGYDLIRTIRQRDALTGQWLPAVALTAYARSEDRVQAIRIGYQMHVTKPVEARELLMVVASLTGRLTGNP